MRRSEAIADLVAAGTTPHDAYEATRKRPKVPQTKSLNYELLDSSTTIATARADKAERRSKPLSDVERKRRNRRKTTSRRARGTHDVRDRELRRLKSMLAETRKNLSGAKSMERPSPEHLEEMYLAGRHPEEST